MDDIYKMKLHEIIEFGPKRHPTHEVMRVHEGWIYRFFNYIEDNCLVDSVYVPFSLDHAKMTIIDTTDDTEKEHFCKITREENLQWK